jgi:hypothetical protein
MSEAWAYQMRVYLADAFAEMARNDPGNAAIKPLAEVLARHDATLKCQFDAFAAYVAEAEAEGVEKFPLYRWTKATLDDPEKRAKHMTAFAIRVAGQEVYAKDLADAIEADLSPLVGGLVTRVSKHDTNPANNLPVPDRFRSSTDRA